MQLQGPTHKIDILATCSGCEADAQTSPIQKSTVGAEGDAKNIGVGEPKTSYALEPKAPPTNVDIVQPRPHEFLTLASPSHRKLHNGLPWKLVSIATSSKDTVDCFFLFVGA